MPTQVCRITQKRFLVPDKEVEHLRKMGESFPFIRDPLPLPTIHPHEYLRRLLSFADLSYLYRGESSLSAKPQLTRYDPCYGYKITTLEEFWSDEVDNTRFGRGYDFSKPFFEQFDALFRDSYHQPLNLINAEGSDYVNGAENVRNCYLCFSVSDSQDCLYCQAQYYGNDNVYCVGTTHCQHCYACVDVNQCYECQHSQDLTNCSNCFSCLDCIGCRDCMGSVGLRSAQYCVLNKQLSKSDYQKFLAEQNLGNCYSRAKLLERCNEVIRSKGHVVNRIIAAEDCTGSYIANCANLYECMHAKESRDCGYIFVCLRSSDCWRGFAIRAELAYQSLTLGTYNTLNCYSTFGGESCLYSSFLYNNCSHCFGCASLKGKSYCILNKQYGKEEYFETLSRIISHMKSTGEWGEFFPPAISPHTYDESWLSDCCEEIPVEEREKRGYRTDPLPEESIGDWDIASEDLPADITDRAVESLVGKVVKCSDTGSLFRFQKQEIAFYKRHGIPLPRCHWRKTLRELTEKRVLIPAVS